MTNLNHDIEKRNNCVAFRTWAGELVVTASCGGWRAATRLEAAMLQQPRRLVILRDLED